MLLLISPVLWLCVALGAGGCNPNQDPTGPEPSQALTPTEIAGIRLTYMCGNTFRVRNPNDQEAAVTWDVYQKNETGSLTLPPKPAGALYSETFFTTVNKGTVRLFYNGQLIQTKANGNKPPCQVTSDTTRPPVPDQDPQITTILEVPAPDGAGTYQRNVLSIVFHDSTSGLTIRNILQRYSGTIIGGFVEPGEYAEYIVQVPDPGPTWELVHELVERIGSEPGVKQVGPLTARTYIQVRGRYPNDAGSSTRGDWFGSPTNGTRPRLAIRAPLAWGCENGLYGSYQPRIAVADFLFDSQHDDFERSTVRFDSLPGGVTRIPSPALTDPTDGPWHRAHGTGVAGVLAATGDNGKGIAGMMWGADLHLYAMAEGQDQALELDRRLRRILQHAGAAGARIFLTSLGIGRAADTAQVALMRGSLRSYLLSGGIIVVPTGNYGVTRSITDVATSTDTLVNGSDRALAQLYPGYPNQIIFAAGTDRNGAFWNQGPGGTSNFWLGASAIAAPAQDVLTLGIRAEPEPGLPAGTRLVSGTSLAAPFVAGVAAQLLAMDPTLGPAQVKDYIVRGAQSARVDPASGALIPAAAVVGAPGTIYQLDAYGSLSLLSRERQGTPICGFPVTLELPQSGPRVRLARNGSNSETIAVNHISGYQVDGLSVAQGGRLFAVGKANFEPNTDPTPMEVDEFALSNGQWSVRRTIPGVGVRTYLEKDTVDSDNFGGALGTRWTLRGPRWGSGTTLRLAETTQPYITPITTPFQPFRYPYTLTAEFSPDGAFAVVRTRLESPPCPNYQDQMWLVTLPNGPVQALLPTQCDGEGPRDAAWDPSSFRFILPEIGANGVTYQARKIISGVAQADGPGVTIPDRFPADYSLGAEGHSTDPSGTTATWLELVQNGCYLTTRTTSTFALVSEQLYPYSNSDWLGFCQVPVQMLRTKPGSRVSLRH